MPMCVGTEFRFLTCGVMTLYSVGMEDVCGNPMRRVRDADALQGGCVFCTYVKKLSTLIVSTISTTFPRCAGALPSDCFPGRSPGRIPCTVYLARSDSSCRTNRCPNGWMLPPSKLPCNAKKRRTPLNCAISWTNPSPWSVFQFRKSPRSSTRTGRSSGRKF